MVVMGLFVSAMGWSKAYAPKFTNLFRWLMSRLEFLQISVAYDLL
jgi:hypothetical protein